MTEENTTDWIQTPSAGVVLDVQYGSEIIVPVGTDVLQVQKLPDQQIAKVTLNFGYDYAPFSDPVAEPFVFAVWLLQASSEGFITIKDDASCTSSPDGAGGRNVTINA